MRRLLRYIRRLFDDESKPVILMYHRVAEISSDPWALAVSPKNFVEQMEIVKSVRLPLRMPEFVAGLEDGTLPTHAVAVTFDDGYVDNVIHAQPILQQTGVPATIFLPTAQLGQKSEFWWDELARMIFGWRTRIDGHVRIGGRSVAVQLPPDHSYVSGQQAWRAWDPPRTPRQHLYVEIWQALRDLNGVVLADAMRNLREVFVPDQPAAENLPMTQADVLRLTETPEIEIGAHSQTHPLLTTLPRDERRQEIEGSRADCEKLIGRPVKGFAYPYGDRDAETMAMVRDGGFEWACSTRGRAVDPQRFNRFDLPRWQVLDWAASAFARELRNVRYRA